MFASLVPGFGRKCGPLNRDPARVFEDGGKRRFEDISLLILSSFPYYNTLNRSHVAATFVGPTPGSARPPHL